MARPVRLEYEGAVYHVMGRGSERGSIYRDEDDRERFLKILRVVGPKNAGWCMRIAS
jgi:hypothetical protein